MRQTRLKTLPGILLGAVLFTVFSAGAAGEDAAPIPAFAQPEVLQAAVAIGLSADQQPEFRAAVREMFDTRMKAINRLLRANNQTNVGRKIRGKTNAAIKKMDKHMARFLLAEQMPAYEHYRDTLKDNMQGM